jgi:dihydrofolate reductase
MRRIVYSVAASLDGFIAGPNGEYDWIPMDPDIDFAQLFAAFDTALMGRRSYEVAAATGWSLPGITSVVVSRTLEAAPPGGLLMRDVAREVPALKAGRGKDIWLWGGGELFRSLLDLGLVDEVEVALVPALLSRGVPLLPPAARLTTLAFKGHRLYPKSGIVMVRYAVEREGTNAVS